MKAATIHQFGPPEVFRYHDVPDPQPGPQDVIVKVAACGINRYDLYLRMGAVVPDVTFPHVMGADIAGTIASTGSQVTHLRSGDQVIVSPGYPILAAEWQSEPMNLADSFEVTGTHTWGGNAEYIRVPAPFVLPITTNPQNLTLEEFSSLPLCLTTAMHAVQTLGEVKPGTRVLVQAGASGSGSMCIQVAKALGATVYTTISSHDKIPFCTRLGASHVIHRKESNFADVVLQLTNGVGVDVVIDCVGASVLPDNLRCLRKAGIFVNFGLVGGMKAELNIRDMFFNQHQLRGSFMGSKTELLQGLTLVAQGHIKPTIDKRFPLHDAAAAHAYIDSRAVQGKVILIP